MDKERWGSNEKERRGGGRERENETSGREERERERVIYIAHTYVLQ